MKNFEFKAERKEIISQKVPEKVKEIYPIFKDIDKMPKGCAVIGGAARNLAFYMVNPSIEGVIPVRDVDVAFSPRKSRKLKLIFMLQNFRRMTMRTITELRKFLILKSIWMVEILR